MVVKLLSLTHRPPLHPGNAPGTHFCYRLSRSQGHSAIGRIISMKNCNDTSWDRTRDLPICSTAPLTTVHCACPRTIHQNVVGNSKTGSHSVRGDQRKHEQKNKRITANLWIYSNRVLKCVSLCYVVGQNCQTCHTVIGDTTTVVDANSSRWSDHPQKNNRSDSVVPKTRHI